MNASKRKQYFHLGDEPILLRTMRIFESCPSINALFPVVPKPDMAYCKQLIAASFITEKSLHITAGGDSRQASVYQGLLAVARAGLRSGMVAIHDGVRPLVAPDRIESCIAAGKESGACILATPANDTLKQVQEKTSVISGTITRSNIWLAQTPQVFRYDIIRNAHEQALEDGISGTDDAMLLERLGIPVSVFPGDARNIKITTREDLVLAEALLKLEEGD